MEHTAEEFSGKPWQVDRYEELSNHHQSVYFDVGDFEEIIDYFVVVGEFIEALKVTNHALRIHSCSISMMLKKAQLLASFNKETHALRLLSQVENMEPSNHDIFLTRGAIYSQLKQYEQAIEEYNKAVYHTDEPDYVYCNIAFEYENLGNFDKTIEYLTKALDLNPENDLAIYEAAYCFDLLSLTEEGITFFRRLIDKHPYSLEAWFNLGVSYINAGLYEKSLEAFDYALAIEPEHEPSWFHKGYALNLMERYPEALEALFSSLVEEETDPMKYYYIGECYEKMDDYEQARKQYLQTIKLDETVADAWVGMGVCEMELTHISEAINYFTKGLELDPDNAGYMCLLGSAYAATGNLKETATAYEKALETDPSDADTWLEYADILFDKDELHTACQLIRRACQAIPENNTLIYRLAVLLLLKGKQKEGVFYLEEALINNFDEHQSVIEKFPGLLLIPAVQDMIEKYRP